MVREAERFYRLVSFAFLGFLDGGYQNFDRSLRAEFGLLKGLFLLIVDQSNASIFLMASAAGRIV